MTDEPDEPTGDSTHQWKAKNFKHFTDPISKILWNAYALVPWELRDGLVLNGARSGSSVVMYEGEKREGKGKGGDREKEKEEKKDKGKGKEKQSSYHKYVNINPVIKYFIDRIEEVVEKEVANDL